MASNYVSERVYVDDRIRELAFAGDGVRLAGQINYPASSTRTTYPLLFILPHAGCNSREVYEHYIEIGLACGYAVFSWDKRGTGRSGAGGRGSTTQDAIYAYETALEQPGIDRKRTIILAQSEGTVMLGNSFGLFARVQHPYGVILAGNMLDPEAILAIDSRIQIVNGERDFHDWRIYAREAAAKHNSTYTHNAAYFVAPGATARLHIDENRRTVHTGAARVIEDWLVELCPASR